MEKYHPVIAALLQKVAEDPAPPLSSLTPAQARAGLNPIVIDLTKTEERIASCQMIEALGPAGAIPIRVYTPEGRPPFPALVFFHGGGWVIGDLDTHESVCVALANGARCMVFSVDYRLAPEHKFPAAVEDALAATNWVFDHAERLGIDPNRIAVGGDSAGGNLATVVAVVARDKGGPPLVLQLLVYPVTDLSTFDTDSYRRHAEKYLLKASSVVWFRDHYLASAQERQDPRASPLLTPDLAGLPPAYIITAEYDVLTDEAEVYGERLRQAGVPVTYRCFEGMIHLFWGMIGIDRRENGIDDAIHALRSAF